jgi:hypothetical protein
VTMDSAKEAAEKAASAVDAGVDRVTASGARVLKSSLVSATAAVSDLLERQRMYWDVAQVLF